MDGSPVEAQEAPIPPFEAVARGSGRVHRDLRRTPRLVFAALGLVRQAAPRELLVTTLLQVLTAALTAAQLILVKRLVGDLVLLNRTSGGNVWSVAPPFIGLVGANLVSSLAMVVLTQRQRLMTDLVTHHTMNGIIATATRVGLPSYEDPAFHDQLERARTAATFRPLDMVNGATTLVTAILTTSGIAAALVTLQPILLPLVLLAGLPVLIVGLINSRESYVFEHGMTAHAREHLHLMDVLTGIEYAKELRTTNAIPVLRERYDGLTRLRLERLREFLRRRMLLSLGGTGIGALGTIIALGSLVWLLTSGRISVATAATAALAMQMLSGRLQMINQSIGRVVEGALFLEDYQRFMGEGESQQVHPSNGGRPSPRFEHLNAEHISFRYPGSRRAALDDVSLEIRPGEVVALVGENGSGKTTLVKLLCQLYPEVDAGRIMWNGTDTRELEPRAVQDRISVLFQDFVRYELTVEDNIALGRPEAPRDPDAIARAAAIAGIDARIATLPSGYETRMGRRFFGGEEMSGGEWQRLALARAFYRDADLLILDEPTAALDPRGEYELFERVATLVRDKAVLLISHRFSNVRMADRIYVLSHGRVVEAGAHEELVHQDGLYSELYRMQAAAYLSEPGQGPPGRRVR